MKDFTLDVVAWNAETDNPDHNVAAALHGWVGQSQPDVIALSEVASHADILARVAPLLGYQLIQETPIHRQRLGRGDDTGDCALMLAVHVQLRHHWVARMRHWWRVVSHDRWHRPHRYEVAAIRVRGQRWRVCAVHFPTLGIDGPNSGAWLESAHWVRSWLHRVLLVPAVVVGDLNEHKARLVEWVGKGIGVAGSGIDVMLTRRVAAATFVELGRGGSDHNGRRYGLVAQIHYHDTPKP